MTYHITHTHIRDIYGKVIWIEPLKEENRLYSPGDVFGLDEVKYRVARVAVADNTQHVNVEIVQEDVMITEPHL